MRSVAARDVRYSRSRTPCSNFVSCSPRALIHSLTVVFPLMAANRTHPPLGAPKACSRELFQRRPKLCQERPCVVVLPGKTPSPLAEKESPATALDASVASMRVSSYSSLTFFLATVLPHNIGMPDKISCKLLFR